MLDIRTHYLCGLGRLVLHQLHSPDFALVIVGELRKKGTQLRLRRDSL